MELIISLNAVNWKVNTVWCARECVYAVCLIAIESPYYIAALEHEQTNIYSWMLLMAIERAFGPRRQRLYTLYMAVIYCVPGIGDSIGQS